MSRELLFRITAKDFDITHIKGSGPGGQHRNKTSTGVRMKHKASGAVAESTEHKSQDANKRSAFRKVIETREFKAWFKTACAEAMGQPTIAQRIDAAMQQEHIVTQIMVDDRWVDVDPSLLEGA